jgi:hypothetical protein
MYWACTRLTTLPDPTKSVEDQDTRLLDILLYVEEVLGKEKERKPE